MRRFSIEKQTEMEDKIAVTYGYIRVSSKDQNEERQRRVMEAYAISPRNLIADRQSGRDFDRPGYRRLMKKLKSRATCL